MTFTRSPLARPYASISTSSLWAVMSPLMSMARAPSESSRTSKVVAASGIVPPSCAAHGAVLVVADCHEVGQPRDLEDLAIVVRQPECLHLDVSRPGLRQEPDDQGDPGAVDVFGALEVQHHGAGPAARCLHIGLVQCVLGGGVQVAR